MKFPLASHDIWNAFCVYARRPVLVHVPTVGLSWEGGTALSISDSVPPTWMFLMTVNPGTPPAGGIGQFHCPTMGSVKTGFRAEGLSSPCRLPAAVSAITPTPAKMVTLVLHDFFISLIVIFSCSCLGFLRVRDWICDR